MSNRPFVLVPIDPAVADRLRRQGGEIFVADSTPGYPCRQCLRDAEPGEELLLVSHDPFDGPSPYRSASPIFLHRQPCVPWAASEIPEQLSCRQLSVRAFDDAEMMVDAAVIAGSDLAATIDAMFASVGVHHLHVHNVGRGCWATRVDRMAG
jgi:hypothetical protein